MSAANRLENPDGPLVVAPIQQAKKKNAHDSVEWWLRDPTMLIIS
jgi:hypothetical protein